ncbi:GIP, partial [Symbiodinium necroappetens]
MDTLTRKRRGAGVSEPEEASGAAEREYETALSQAEPKTGSGGSVSGTLLNGVAGGDASPGTLESGEARAREQAYPFPSASPFHSDRVKAEVELIRTRPVSLDEDARKFTKEYDDAALGDAAGTLQQEPDYAALTGDHGVVRDAPRVARVEPSSGDQGVIRGAEEPFLAAPTSGSGSAPRGPAGLGLTEPQASTVEIEEAAGGDEDVRELIPAEDRFERMEALLLQVVEENRSLKRRLDQQIESRSHSSYHSGVATADQAFSPATFGPRVDASVQQFMPVDFPGQGGMMGSGFMGLMNRSPEPEPPQTMRQFAESVRVAEASQGLSFVSWWDGDPSATFADCAGADDVEKLRRCAWLVDKRGTSVLIAHWSPQRIEAKRITEDADPKPSSAGSSGASVSSASPIVSQEALVAEATKLLKGVALRAIGVEEGPDWSWVRSALASASNPEYCLIDSGATNALRPAEADELKAGKVIRVDLASGTTELRINEFGTLLHGGQCQVILPASYLVDLGYSISWKRKGCTVKHPKQGGLQVIVVKGCPLIPREVGLGLLQAYEDKRAGRPVLSKVEVEDLGSGLVAGKARMWLRERLQLRSETGISEVDQLIFLRAMFPQVPLKSLARACAVTLSSENVDWTELPWSRRLRRSIDRAEEGSVMVAVPLVFQALMKWAHSGVIGALVKGAEGFTYELYGRPHGIFVAFGPMAFRLVTSSWFLYEAIHEVRVVGWVGNLLHLVQRAWLMWKWEQGRYKEVLERRLILKKLTEEEAYRSVDLAGPFISGQSWDVEASGRDRGKGYKYFLACAYAVPDKYVPAAPVEDDTAEYAPSECGELLSVPPDEAGLSAPVGAPEDDLFGDLWELPVPGLNAVTHRVKGKKPESGAGALGSAELPDARSPAKSGGVAGVVHPPLLPFGLKVQGDFVVIGDDLDGSEPETDENLTYVEEEEAGSGFFFEVGHPSWTGVTIDVKSAFLYAPIRSEGKGTEDEYHLVQTLSDDALWLARKTTRTGYGDIEGILVVYVDDLAFLAPRGLGEAFVAAVQERWKTSTPEWFSERPLTFCGMELSQHDHGYRMSQSAYVRELLGRYCIEESASTPITRWAEPEVGSPPSSEEVKEAQAITGALLWLSTRTRPDIAYVVSRCGQQATKCPGLSVSLGKQALAYLRTTVDMGIEVPHVVGRRSVQGIFLLWKGVPVTWESSRQSFVTLSSAEAELVTMISGLQTAEAVLPLVQELIEQDVTISLLADNEAAIRAFDAAWRYWLCYREPKGNQLKTGVALAWGWWWLYGFEVWQVMVFEQCIGVFILMLGMAAEEWLLLR